MVARVLELGVSHRVKPSNTIRFDAAKNSGSSTNRLPHPVGSHCRTGYARLWIEPLNGLAVNRVETSDEQRGSNRQVGHLQQFDSPRLGCSIPVDPLFGRYSHSLPSKPISRSGRDSHQCQLFDRSFTPVPPLFSPLNLYHIDTLPQLKSPHSVSDITSTAAWCYDVALR